jgi:hypothetical protein
MINVGIDPGKDGAIAFIADDGIVEVRAAVLGANDRAALLARRYAPSLLRVYIEKSQAFPGQGGVGNHSTGMDYGQWLTILDLYDIPYQIVTVQSWQKVMLAGKPSPPKKPDMPALATHDGYKQAVAARQRITAAHRKEVKEFAATVAQRLFPTVNLKRTEKCAGPHDGAVDALLIAEYCRRTWR